MLFGQRQRRPDLEDVAVPAGGADEDAEWRIRSRTARARAPSGVRVARSATSSIPQARPTPRMSPIAWCRPRARQGSAQRAPVALHAVEHALVLDYVEDRQRRGRAHRVAAEGAEQRGVAGERGTISPRVMTAATG